MLVGEWCQATFRAMGLRLYNTIKRRVEPFAPLAPPRVTMYTCGPTVWSYAHIGNFRTFLSQDLLRRYLEYLGYEVFQVMNLTDVDDRIIAEAKKAGKTIRDHTEPFTAAFFEDRDYLGIKPADVYPRATESIEPMVRLVEGLLERGVAYRADDRSVYFGVDKFEEYGRLSQLDKRVLRSGSRVDSDEYSKEDVRDFALWKAASQVDEEVEAAWDAPFGRGRPGWHLECSAMALDELRTRFDIETLDIHAGGVDLIFPHHENEIAQSEAVTGKPFVRCWMHGEFLTVEGTKMSKRYGNFLTARDLREERIDPAAVRMLFFQTHYRKQVNFTDQALEAAGKGAERIGELHRRLIEAAAGCAAGSPDEVGRELEERFRAALDEDLNAPSGLAALAGFVTAANRALDAGEWSPEVAAGNLRALDRVTEVLRILPRASSDEDQELQAWVTEKIAERGRARAANDFTTSDAIRDELAGRGILLEDTAGGTRWKRDGG